jgi:hypothetical protein
MKVLIYTVFLATWLSTTLEPSRAQNPGPQDTFTNAKLSPEEIKEIVAAIELTAYDTPDSWTDELRVKRVELGSLPGLVVRGSKLLCGGTGNCQTWVFGRKNGKWLCLFGDENSIVEGVQLGPEITNGIKDLTVSANSSAEQSTTQSYKFDGTKYRAK